MTALKVGLFGDAGNALTNGTSFYYSPGFYQIYSVGASGPLQQAVNQMMRSWAVSDLIQLGDAAYNANASTLLDYNIGQFYNDFQAPYGNSPGDFLFSDPTSIYSLSEQGGVQAVAGNKKWPYNLYDFPNGFPNPSTGGRGGSVDGKNHFWLVAGNHDSATVLGSYSDANVTQVDYDQIYVGRPSGPDAFDYANNINTTPPPPDNGDFQFDGEAWEATSKIGSTKQLLDYLPYLKTTPGRDPSYLKPGQVRIGKAAENGTGIYYGLDLGETTIDAQTVPLLHVTAIDTSLLLADAGYYEFNFQEPSHPDNFRFDPTDPDPSSGGQLRPPGTPADAPSLSYQMYAWAKQDLEQSNALWKVVLGHHPGYASGATTSVANDTYFNNPGLIKLLAGLKDEQGEPLLDAYFSGHLHAYSRVLETAESPDGVGTGIPFFVMGNGGKVLDPLNLAPYGSNVLEPQNFKNVFTRDGVEYSNGSDNFFASQADYVSYLAELPQAARPTSVGLSSFYAYSGNNYPNGYDASSQDDNPAEFELRPAVPNPQAASQSFTLSSSAYGTLLAGDPASTDDISGLYGYGSGGACVEVDQGYFWTSYQTSEVLDPAILLLGRQQGLADEAMKRGSLFYAQWSPESARPEDLAMFSFDVIVNADQSDASLDHLQLVSRGKGYLEQAIGGKTYRDGSYTFEILGNNPVQPLGFDQLDPSRAAVELSFRGGELVDLRFARDSEGRERRGSGYLELANAINDNNLNQSSLPGNSLLVGVNINLEAQYTFADQAPGNELYQDWYLQADTAIASSSIPQGSFGSLRLNLQPSAARAREILASQPITTGYSGSGAQASYPNPQQGLLTIRDAAGNLLAGNPQAPLRFDQGSTQLRFDQLPAPGNLQVDFGGDAISSYLVNHRPASTSLALQYGRWDAGLSVGSESSLLFSRDLPITLVRSDSLPGRVSFGLRQSGSTLPVWLLENATPASSAALDTARLFISSGNGSWLASEGQRQGGSAASRTNLAAGSWSPVARDANGKELSVESISVSANTAVVEFSGGIQARYGTAGTGTLSSPEPSGPPVVTIKRLGFQENGLGFYPFDPLTGAIEIHGRTLLPGESGYLQGALDLARAESLLLSPSQLPSFGSEVTFTDLSLDPARSYALLLLRNGDSEDLSSSFASANPDGIVTMQSFAAPGRGVIFGVEDLKPAIADFDFNDLSVILSSSSFELLNPALPTVV